MTFEESMFWRAGLSDEPLEEEREAMSSEKETTYTTGSWGSTARRIDASSRMAETLLQLIAHGFCPACGCDQWNTAGCPICPVMREANESLADAGIVERRKFAAYAEPDEINKRNLAEGRA